MSQAMHPAPEIVVDQWFNCEPPLSIGALQGRVIVIEAFQMLCPGCVAHGIPQAQRIGDAFPQSDVAVLGLHTVFEHHKAMSPVSLRAFLHEYRVTFPVAVDQPDGSGIPKTMRAYNMRGTPTLILIDALGRLRQQWFGKVDDLVVGAEIMRLIHERSAEPKPAGTSGGGPAAGVCDNDACSI
jgi:hypothetical protein